MSKTLYARRFSTILFILLLGVLFALQWGPGSKGCDTNVSTLKNEVAATVNGKEISLREYRLSLSDQLAALRQQGSPITEELARQFGFHTQVLDRMVNIELLAQAAEKEGLQTSDEELLQFLQRQEAFKTDGQFDPQRYKDIVRDYYRKTEVEFENDLRKQLAAEKMQNLLESSVQVSEDEVRTRYFKEYDKAQATFVRFTPAMFVNKAAPVKDAEVSAFVKASMPRIQEFFEANTFRFHQAEKVRARHILLKADPTATPEAKAEIKKKLENLREQIVAGKDFAEAAKEFSEDTGSRESGGELGLNERAAWVTPFSDAAFSLNVGDISAPVETQFGFHLIQVQEKQPPVTKKVDEVASEIAKELLTKDLAKAVARAEAMKALAALKTGKKTLQELYPSSADTQTNAMRFAVESKPEAIDTQEINAGTDNLPQMGPAPELLRAIFAVDAPRTLEAPFEVGEAFVVAVVTKRSRPSEEEFKAQRETLVKEALTAKQADVQDAFIKGLRKAGSVVINEQAIAGSPSNG